MVNDQDIEDREYNPSFILAGSQGVHLRPYRCVMAGWLPTEPKHSVGATVFPMKKKIVSPMECTTKGQS